MTTDWAFKDVNITGDLSVRRIQPEDFQRIASAIDDPQGFYARTNQIDTQDKIIEMLTKNHEAHLAGTCNPVLFTVDQQIVGITRFFRFDTRRRSLEIGGTWMAPKWRRTFVNTKAKLLLMELAFESFGAERVEYVVNSINLNSQMAVLRIGAKREGILRRTHSGWNGEPADGFLYSVTRPDWPEVKSNLARLLQGQRPIGSIVPQIWNGPRTTVRAYTLEEALPLLQSFQRNRSALERSFPCAARVHTLDHARAYIADKAHLLADRQGFFGGIWERSDGARLIGQVQIKNFDGNLKSAELGYYIDCDLRRQGYATEVLKMAIHELVSRQGFSRLTVRILPEIRESFELANKLGFRKEGLLRSGFRSGTGELADVILMSLVPGGCE
jgi:N-acetyltransferase